MKIEFFLNNAKDDSRVDEDDKVITVMTTVEDGDDVTPGSQYSAQFRASQLPLRVVEPESEEDEENPEDN